VIWNRDWECCPRDKLREIQLERLQETVERVYERVPFYRQALQSRGLRPQDIKSLEDVRLLPFTTKEDFRRHYPYGLFAVPL